MKEKIVNKIKESKKPPGVKSDEKEKVKVRRRKEDKECASSGRSLEDQFKDIVATARSDAVIIMMNKKSQNKSPVSSQDRIEAKKVQVSVEDCISPGRPNVTHDKADVAPSPITPPLPKRMRLATPLDDDDAPSPEGMSLNQLSQSCGVNHTTEVLCMKNEPQEMEEATFFDAQDTSIIESGNGLNLDGLIDEIFVYHTNGLDPKVEEEDPLCFSPEKRTDNTQAENINQSDLFTTPANRLEATETECSAHSASSPLQSEGTGVSSKISQDGTERTVNGQQDSGTQHTGLDENQDNLLRLALNAPVAAALSSKNSNNDKDIVAEPVLPILNLSNGVSESSHGKSIEVVLNEECFHDDLSLSDSQILAIEAECNLVGATTVQPAVDLIQNEGVHTGQLNSLHMGPAQTEKPSMAPIQNGRVCTGQLNSLHMGPVQTENSSMTPIQNEVHLGQLNCLQTGPAQTENPNMAPAKPTLDLGFSLPSAPRLNWTQKALESRQRLRSITQEISRLNAMVLRARRTLWPRQLQEVDRQHAAASATSSQSSHLQTVTLQDHYKKSQVSDICHDPEWNIS